MARYNSALTSNTITGTATIGSPYSGAFTEFTGTAPYTVTLPTPVAFPGVTQTFYNATGGTVTLSTPSGNFVGTGSTSATTIPIYAGNVINVISDGTNYVVISEDGSPLIATTGSFSGNVTINGGSATLSVTPSVVTMAPTASSTIDNIAIGATTRASGAFTTLASNNAVTFTANTASSSTTTGSLVVTGGIGASGTVYAGAFNGNLTGTLQTAAQPNITSHGALTSLTVSGFTGLGAAPAHTSGVQWQGFTGALELNGGVGSIGATTNGLYLQGNQFWDGSVGWSAHALGASSQMLLGKGSISANVYASASANAAVGASQAGWNLSNTGFAITGGDLSHSSANPSAGVNFYIKNTTDTGGDNTRYAGIQFQIGSDVGTAAIQAYRTASAVDYSTALTFLTKGNGAPATNPVERMRIDANGKVGINVTPAAGTDAKLQVTGGTTNVSSLLTSYSTAAVVVVPKSSSGYSLAIASGPGDLPQIQVSANGTASGNLLIQPYGGNVGIGTTSPSTRLVIDTGSTTNAGAQLLIGPSSGTAAVGDKVVIGFKLQNTAGGGTGNTYAAGIAGVQDASAQNSGALVFYTQYAAGDGTPERMRIDNAGNVGIGTISNPGTPVAGRLSILPAANATTIATSTTLTLGETTNNSAYQLRMAYSYLASTYTGVIDAVQNSAGAPLSINSTGGNVGIGNTAPQYKFDVGPVTGTQSATVGASGLIRNAAGADSAPYTQARIVVYGGTGVDTANWGYFAYGADGLMKIVYGKTGSSLAQLAFGTTSATDGTGAFTERMRIDANSNLKLSSSGTKILNSSGNPILQQTGSVLQVVTNYPSSGAVYTQAVSTYAEITTAYRTSITPISTSSILILEWVGLIGGANSGNISTMKFYDVTNSADVGLSGISLGSRGIGHGSFRQVDTDVNDRDNIILRVVIPNSTTTARTYSLYHYSEGAVTKYFNATGTDNNGCSYVKWHFTITEISA